MREVRPRNGFWGAFFSWTKASVPTPGSRHSPVLSVRLTDLLYFLRQISFPKKPSREEDEDSGSAPSRLEILLEAVKRGLRSRESVGTLVSLVLHGLLILWLSWLMLPAIQEWGGLNLTSNPDIIAAIEDIQAAIPNEPDTTVEMPVQETETPPERVDVVVAVETAPTQEEDRNATVTNSAVATIIKTPTEQAVTATPRKMSGDFVSGAGFAGRTPEGRGRAVGSSDSSGAGEDAVEKALAWLAAHQMKDGGWSFDFARSCPMPPEGRCTNSGTHGSRLAATALALLPFLGAGYTHETGPYQRQVGNGLGYLIESAARGQRGLDFMRGGDKGMYTHGIAAMALCEAHAMSKRKRKDLQQAAQEALRFIEEAQDQHGGGWRYKPNESPGDLSVTTWQMMALKSGRLGGLQVSQPVLYNAALFLDAVQTDGGRQYRYVPTDGRQGAGPDSAATCSACGLLLRMYLGWKPGDSGIDGKALDEGIDLIARHSAIKDDATCNLYYAYYATLALHHFDGSHWRAWNEDIRDFLVQTQSGRGHESGSWYFPDPHYCDHGGRLLNTVLAALILETPYRIMPLFRKQ